MRESVELEPKSNTARIASKGLVDETKRSMVNMQKRTHMLGTPQVLFFSSPRRFA